nr:immunoglobulin heavy chain junction region [Macaca mulatta]
CARYLSFYIGGGFYSLDVW